MDLRPYQRLALRKTLEALRDKKSNKQVWVMATGTGKTVCFARLSSYLIEKTQKKVLILAHREELLDQARNKLLTIDPTLKVGIEQADNHVLVGEEMLTNNIIDIDHQLNPDVVVASVPTLGRKNSERIKKFNPKDFGLIIVDECHHASANSYLNVLRYFGVLKKKEATETQGQEILEKEDANWNTDCLLLGVTATPSRADNQGIDAIFDDVVFEYNIIQAIQEGYLSPIRAMRIRTAVDLTNIGRTAGDFNLGELEEAVNIQERNELIVKAYQEIVPGLQALVFAVDIAHAMALTEAFVAAGINASFVIGATDKQTRIQRLKDFHEKKINVMVNVGVLTEGVDIPSVDAVMMARPTQSGILYSQMLGRGTRLYPGKDHLTVIDFVDNTRRQHLQTVASLLGKPEAIDFKGRDILEVGQELEELQQVNPNLDLENLDVTQIKTLIEKAKYEVQEVDLLSFATQPSPLTHISKFKWQAWGKGYRLSLPKNKETNEKISFTIVDTDTITDKFLVRKYIYDTTTGRTTDTIVLGSYNDLDSAVRDTDNYIESAHSDILTLIKATARWHRDTPSEAQISYLMSLIRKITPNSEYYLSFQQYDEDSLMQLTKGEVSALIDTAKKEAYKNKPYRPRQASIW